MLDYNNASKGLDKKFLLSVLQFGKIKRKKSELDKLLHQTLRNKKNFNF